jgi:integrase
MKLTELAKGKWSFDFNCRGHRINRIVFGDRRRAEDEAVKVRAEILNGKFSPLKEKGKHRDDGSFGAHADEFLELYSKQKKKSWRRDELSIAHLKAFFGSVNLQDITMQQIERYQAARRADGVSDKTTNRELACLKTMLQRAVHWEKLGQNPAARVKKFREKDYKWHILTADEEARLMRVASDELRAAVIIALNTGMRKSEILGLRWEDAHRAEQHPYIFVGDSKSGKTRKVPINARVQEALLSLPQSGEYVFSNGNGGHVLDNKTAFHAACRRAKKDPNDKNDPGILEFRFHDCRHTCATRMVEAGVDLVTVSKILGHSSITMTMKYAHPTDESMRRAVEKLADATGAKVEPRSVALVENASDSIS